MSTVLTLVAYTLTMLCVALFAADDNWFMVVIWGIAAVSWAVTLGLQLQNRR